MVSTTETVYLDETKNGSTTFGLYDYFADNTDPSFKGKAKQGETSNTYWWSRSPGTDGPWWHMLNAYGIYADYTSSGKGIALCLAI